MATGSITKPLSTITGTITNAGVFTSFESAVLKRYGNVVFLYLATGNIQTSLTTSYTTIATIPEEFRPTTTIIKTCILYIAGSTRVGMNYAEPILQITYTGNVQIAAPANLSTFTHLRAYCTWIVDD